MSKYLLSVLLSADESDVYLSVGVAFLFIGLWKTASLPFAIVILGLIFIGIAFLSAKKEAISGTP